MKTLSELIAPLIRKFEPYYLSRLECETMLLDLQNRLKEVNEETNNFVKTGNVSSKKRKSYLHGAINPFDVPTFEKSLIRYFDSTHRTKKEYLRQAQITEGMLTLAKIDLYNIQQPLKRQMVGNLVGTLKSHLESRVDKYKK